MYNLFITVLYNTCKSFEIKRGDLEICKKDWYSELFLEPHFSSSKD